MIQIYTSKQCAYCVELTEKLTKLELKFVEIDVDDAKNKEPVGLMFEKAGEAVIPIIVIPPHILVPKRSFVTIDNAIDLIQNTIIS